MANADTEITVHSMCLIAFVNDDFGYLKWVQENKSGYVVNYTLQSIAANLSLHRANCSTVSSRNKTTWTTNGHVKTCSNDREKLVKWAKESFGHEPLPCANCKP